MKFATKTHKGNKRSHNEDFIYANFSLGLWIVADGMGGHSRGEVASCKATERVAENIEQGISLYDAIIDANDLLIELNRDKDETSRMGTTIVVLKVEDDKYEIGWVGDSRAYLWSGKKLKQLTRDHSYVQKLVEIGAISEQEKEHHQQKNIITQALGTVATEELDIEIISNQLYRGEQILLCSDGLTSEVADTEINTILSNRVDEERTANLLLKAALDHGGTDNISVILVSAQDNAPINPQKGDTEPLDSNAINLQAKTNNVKSILARCFVIVVIVLLIGIIIKLI